MRTVSSPSRCQVIRSLQLLAEGLSWTPTPCFLQEPSGTHYFGGKQHIGVYRQIDGIAEHCAVSQTTLTIKATLPYPHSVTDSGVL